MRILCLDVGDKFIGVAISDAGGISAHGLKRISRGRWASELREIVDEYHEEIDRIVVGLPKRLDGSIGIQAEKALGFVEELRKTVDLPVILWDERFSTVSAERAMIEAGVKGRRRRGLKDKMSAVIILQSYLDSVRR